MELPENPKSASELDISVIFPAYQEQDYIATAVKDVVEGLTARNLRFEVVTVENGSKDQTRQRCDELAKQYPQVKSLYIDQANYGLALRHGLLAARGEYVVNFDVDLYDMNFLDGAIAKMSTGTERASIVVASKRGEGSNDTRHWSRKIVTGVFSTALKVVFGLKVSDTHGMKAMRRSEVTEHAQVCVTGTDLFDTELILRCERAGLKSTEIGVKIEETRPARTPIAGRIFRSVRGLGHLYMVFRKEAKAINAVKG